MRQTSRGEMKGDGRKSVKREKERREEEGEKRQKLQMRKDDSRRGQAKNKERRVNRKDGGGDENKGRFISEMRRKERVSK